jgi:hypothetical protein
VQISVAGYVQSLVLLQRSMQLANASPSRRAHNPVPPRASMGQSASLVQLVRVHKRSVLAPFLMLAHDVPAMQSAVEQPAYACTVPVLPPPGRHTVVLAPIG